MSPSDSTDLPSGHVIEFNLASLLQYEPNAGPENDSQARSIAATFERAFAEDLERSIPARAIFSTVRAKAGSADIEIFYRLIPLTGICVSLVPVFLSLQFCSGKLG
jgi:hypothetical protein